MGTKKTHEVTQAFLKSWLSDKEKRKGVWVYDIERQKLLFLGGDKPFSFAAENYLYIPLISGDRDESAEKWLAEVEGELMQFIDRILLKDFASTITQDHFEGVLLGLLSLGYRSAYEIKFLQGAITLSPELRAQYHVESERDVHRAVVELMINMITMQAEKYYRASHSVLYNLSKPLLVCDRPLFDAKLRGTDMAVCPVSPSAAIMLDCTQSTAAPEVSFHDAEGERTGDLCDMLNSFTIERARKWIVATTKSQLDDIMPLLTLEKLQERQRSDKTVLVSPEQHGGTNWWRLKGKKA